MIMFHGKRHFVYWQINNLNVLVESQVKNDFSNGVSQKKNQRLQENPLSMTLFHDMLSKMCVCAHESVRMIIDVW